MSTHFLHPPVSVFDQLSGHSAFRALTGPSGPASQAGKPGVASRRCFPGCGHSGPSSLRLAASGPFPAIGPGSDVGGLSSCCRSVFHCWITTRAADGPPLGGSSGIRFGCVSYSSRLNRRARREFHASVGGHLGIAVQEAQRGGFGRLWAGAVNRHQCRSGGLG